jgi:arylsulfatase A-like enzyme
MGRRTKIVIAVAAAAVVLIGGVVTWKVRADARPNIIVIMTDDQTFESLRVMANVNGLLVSTGTTFSHYYVATPNCCPSRAEFFTGRYAHNNGVKDNLPPLGGAKAFEAVKAETLPVWLQRSGYYTAHIGKYLNGWGNEKESSSDISPPPGWDHWFAGIDPWTYQYYNFQVSNDGNAVEYGDTPDQYQTDVFGYEVLYSIHQAVERDQPFFVSFAPLAPHVGRKEAGPGDFPDSIMAVPAPRHDGMFAAEPLPPAPSRVFGGPPANSSDLAGKPKFVRDRASNPWSFPERSNIEATYRKHLESLLAVDEWVGHIWTELDRLGVLDDTVIVFTSDNGLFFGEHGLQEKGLLYEEATHVPLIISGPGFPENVTAEQLAVNVDLAPTILGLANASAPIELDGLDLRKLAGDPAYGTQRAILLEQWYTYTGVSTQAVRAGDWSYIEWSTGERELYDLASDPFQMTNLSGEAAHKPTIDQLAARLAALRACRGPSCVNL